MSYASGRAWEAAGRGLRGIGSIYADTQRLREEEERRKAEDARIAAIDAERGIDVARRREREDLDTALDLADQGGGMGPGPTERAEIMGTGSLPALTERSLFPEPQGGLGLQAPPPPHLTAPSALSEPISYDRPDPNFQNVGPGHIEKQDVRATRLRVADELRKSDAEAGERARRATLGPSIGSIASGKYRPGSPEYDKAAGAIYAEGGNPTSYAPEEYAPRAPVQWEREKDASGRVWQVNPVTGEKRDIGITAALPETGGSGGFARTQRSWDSIYADIRKSNPEMTPEQRARRADEIMEGRVPSGDTGIPKPWMDRGTPLGWHAPMRTDSAPPEPAPRAPAATPPPRATPAPAAPPAAPRPVAAARPAAVPPPPPAIEEGDDAVDRWISEMEKRGYSESQIDSMYSAKYP